MPKMNDVAQAIPEGQPSGQGSAAPLDTARAIASDPRYGGPGSVVNAMKEETDPLTEQLPDQESPAQDEIWRASLRAEMRPVALRHGRKLFVLCASIGVFSGGLERMVQAGQQTGNTLMNLHARKAAEGVGKAIGAAHAQMLQGVNGLVELSVLLGGWTQAEIIECQTDIKRAAELVMAEPGKTASGIILPMH